MIHFARLVVLLLLVASPLAGQTPKTNQSTAKANQTAQSLTLPEKDGRIQQLHYLLFLPQDYDANKETSKQFPLLIFLHGRGERGSDLNLVKKWGPPRIVQQRPDFPFVVVSPQCPASAHGWKTDQLKLLVEDVLDQRNVDPNRVYLTGLSMGGYGAWALAARHPQLFAAVVPVCGGGSTESANQLVDLPVWAFHGADDYVVPVSQTSEMVQAVQQAGGKKIKMTIYPDVGHDSWRQAYADPKLYEWLLQQQRTDKTQ